MKAGGLKARASMASTLMDRLRCDVTSGLLLDLVTT